MASSSDAESSPTFPPVTVQFSGTINLLPSTGDGVIFSSKFRSKRRGYELILALRASATSRPTAEHPKVKPTLHICVLAPPQEKDQKLMKWPFKGNIKMRFIYKKSNGKEEFLKPLSIEFLIDKPLLCEPSSPRILRMPSITWTTVRNECTSGEWTWDYINTPPLSRLHVQPHPIGSSLPSTLYVQVEKIIHRRS